MQTMQSGLPNADLLTVEEVAARLKLKPSWVYSHADDLGVFRLGKYLRFESVLERSESPPIVALDGHPALPKGDRD